MDQASSVNATSCALVAQPRFEPVIHRRFVRDSLVTLELEDRFWTRPRRHELEIKDVTTGKVIFHVPPRTCGLSIARRLLLDALGVPVVGLEEYSLEPKHAQRRGFVVIPDGRTATKELCRFETHFNPFELPLELCLNKQNPNECVQIQGGNMWLSRRSCFTIQRGGSGARQTIAQVNYVGRLSDGKYQLSVAPGVDVALMVMFAAAMEDQAHAFASSVERRYVERVLKSESERDHSECQAQARIKRATSAPTPYQAGRSKFTTLNTIGANQGYIPGADKPLIPQRNFEGAIHRRFVKDTVVTFELQDQFWSQPRDHTIEIKNATHDRVLFKVPPVSGGLEKPKRKLLLDAYGVPDVGMEGHDLPSPPARLKAFAVIPDGFAATKELFRFKTRLNVFNDMPLHLNFKDEDSFDAPTQVVVRGRWLTQQVPIAIQRDGGDFFMIARTYPVGSLLDGKY